jgi:hypothetical protein
MRALLSLRTVYVPTEVDDELRARAFDLLREFRGKSGGPSRSDEEEQQRTLSGGGRVCPTSIAVAGRCVAMCRGASRAR